MTTLREEDVLKEVNNHRRRSREEIRSYVKTSHSKGWSTWLPRPSSPVVFAPAMLAVATVGIIATAFVVHAPSASSSSGSANGGHVVSSPLSGSSNPSPTSPATAAPSASTTNHPATLAPVGTACAAGCSVQPTTVPPASTPTAPSGSHPVLMGDAGDYGYADQNPAGTADAWETSATSSGQLTSVTVNITSPDSGTLGKLMVGIYTTSSSGDPETRISEGELDNPVASAAPGTWNVVSVTSAQITQGQKYWIALLSPDGTFKFRYAGGTSSGDQSEGNSQTGLTSLPLTWGTPTTRYTDGPLEAYARG